MTKIIKEKINSYTVFMNSTKIAGEKKRIITEEQQKSKLTKGLNLLV